MRVTVEDATMAHVEAVEDDIRVADMREWYAGTGRPFLEAVAGAFKSADPKRVALLDGLPICFWGWDPEGNIWLFATDTAVEHFFPLHRVLRPELARIHAQCPKLTAKADARNTVHHEWMRWLGFKEVGVEHFAPFGLPFLTFTREA